MANYPTPLSSGFCASCIGIADGVRQIMVDFGLAGFLEKFEARFGSKATTSLLFLIGIAVAAVCVNTFYSMAVKPVFTSIAVIWNSQSFSISGYWDLLRDVVILMLVLALAGSFWRILLIKKQSIKNMQLLTKIMIETILAGQPSPEQLKKLEAHLNKLKGMS